MSKKHSWAMILLASAVAGQAEAGFTVTANNPKVTASTISGVTTETFEGATLGNRTSMNTAIGTLTSPGFAILANDQYGGATGSSQYISIGAQSGYTSMTLTLATPESYFGLLWSAADAGNQLSFLSGGKVIAYLNTAVALSDLSSSYLGNPTTGADSAEKFAYLNFYGTQGTTFDQIVFTNASTATGWESDNWSVLSTQASSTPGTTLNNAIVMSTVPEPSSLVMASMGLVGGIGVVRRLRRQALA